MRNSLKKNTGCPEMLYCTVAERHVANVYNRTANRKGDARDHDREPKRESLTEEADEGV